MATPQPSWIEHADLIIKFVGFLFTLIGGLITTLAVILWGMLRSTRKAVALLCEKYSSLPEAYIEKSFCESKQQNKQTEREWLTNTLDDLKERQGRIEDSINDLRTMMIKSMIQK